MDSRKLKLQSLVKKAAGRYNSKSGPIIAPESLPSRKLPKELPMKKLPKMPPMQRMSPPALPKGSRPFEPGYKPGSFLRGGTKYA